MTNATKRAFDIVVSLMALAVLWPLFLGIALVTRQQMGSPILFRQVRPGLHHMPFTLYKFRSMRDGTENDEERLTKFGKVLRATSFDELPELWNVLKGDMSLVGPRPLLMDYLTQYSDEQARRHLVRPGITGWAQINGRNDIPWKHKLLLDVWYVDNHSLWLDLEILLVTPLLVLRQRGVSKQGQATSDQFAQSKP